MSRTKPMHIIIILFTQIARCPGRLSLVEKYTGHVHTPCADMLRTMGHVRTRTYSYFLPNIFNFWWKLYSCNMHSISTTNLAACVSVCVCAKFDQFLPARSHFDSKCPENFVRIATFPSATFGPLFAFHCPLFFYEKQ